MSAPRIKVQPTSGIDDIKMDTSPSWLVYFVRFAEPTTSHTTPQNFLKEDPAIIVINDCVSVNVSNPKGQSGKTANLTLKEGDVYYPYAVSPGDWCFVWMCDNREDVDQVFRWLQDSKKDPKKKPNGYNSGFKFAGRVKDLGNVDVTSPQGVRTVTQTIECQSFLELASTVYFTSFTRDIIGAEVGVNSNTSKVQTKGSNAAEGAKTFDELKSNAILFANRVLEKAIGQNNANKFQRYFSEFSLFGKTPDQVISYIFTSLMGMDPVAFKSVEKNKNYNSQPTFSTAIKIPSSVASIFGRKSTSKDPLLWQMYNIILGVQQYNTNTSTTSPWKSFFPKIRPTFKSDGESIKGTFALEGTDNIFYQTSSRLEGRIPYFPPLWDNKSVWAFMQQNLNSLVNEMYTCLRPGPDGNIVPTLVIREKPFSTGLFNFLDEEASKSLKARKLQIEEDHKKLGTKKKSASQIRIEKKEKIRDSKEKSKLEEESRLYSPASTEGKKNNRTSFFNIPRWVIPAEMIVGVKLVQQEQNRINMSMVIPNNRFSYISANLTQEELMTKVYQDGTFCVDPEDIARNGLRADIQSSNFDHLNSDGDSVALVWSRMRADWSFNGHLKLVGTITLKGVQQPITEGDNLEHDGILFHIESVNHSAVQNPNGTKTFNTVCSVSNGLLAASSMNKRPNYYTNRRKANDSVNGSARVNDVPGITDSQQTEHRNRNNTTGEKIKKRSR